MDFTIAKYKLLLESLKGSNYTFQSFNNFLSQSLADNIVILRHDVDLLPQNSLRFAKIQAELGIKGSYYFRAVPESWNENIIKEIAGLGHEVGYHYENMDTAYRKAKGKRRKYKVEKGSTEYAQLIDMAYEDFCINLEKLRKLVPVSTICMHGSPRSQFDNKEIWTKYDYKSLGIVGEPYFDVDFNKVFYLTDTGRRWDGWKTSVRDKVPQQEEWIKQGLVFHSTQDIIDAVNSECQPSSIKKTIPFSGHPLGRGKDEKRNGFFNQNSEIKLPSQIMFTMHPQRWHDSTLLWVKELVLQNIKNQVKKFLFVK